MSKHPIDRQTKGQAKGKPKPKLHGGISGAPRIRTPTQRALRVARESQRP